MYGAMRVAMPPQNVCSQQSRGEGQRGLTVSTWQPSSRKATAALAETARTSGSDRKSTRLNSSHLVISYAVFCLKKKKDINTESMTHLVKLHLNEDPASKGCGGCRGRSSTYSWYAT